MLLYEIDQRWQECRSDVHRELRWAELTRPSGIWFRCFRDIASPEAAFPAALTGLFETWLDGTDASSPARFCREGFSLSRQLRLLRTCYQCALLARTAQDAVPTASEIEIIADQAGLAPGRVADLFRSVTGKQLRPAHASVQLIVLLINDDHAGVPAALRLECLAKGTGSLYPTPWLGLCRDRTFVQAEALAAGTLSKTNDIDVRWTLQRLDGKPLGHLTGPSMAGAFALGLHYLVDRPSDLEPGYLAQVAVSSTLDETGRFTPVGGLWGKLDREAMRLANPHTLIVSSDQTDLPPRYLEQDACPMVLQARDPAHALHL